MLGIWSECISKFELPFWLLDWETKLAMNNGRWPLDGWRMNWLLSNAATKQMRAAFLAAHLFVTYSNFSTCLVEFSKIIRRSFHHTESNFQEDDSLDISLHNSFGCGQMELLLQSVKLQLIHFSRVLICTSIREISVFFEYIEQLTMRGKREVI